MCAQLKAAGKKVTLVDHYNDIERALGEMAASGHIILVFSAGKLDGYIRRLCH